LQCGGFRLILQARIRGRIAVSNTSDFGLIAVAACSLEALKTLGEPHRLGRYTEDRAVVITTGTKGDTAQLWVSPGLSNYKAAWERAIELEASLFPKKDESNRCILPLEATWGSNTDLDHLYAKSWAMRGPNQITHVRLFPVWAEVNRSAGAGREKAALKAGLRQDIRNGIIYAEDIQVMKIIGHPISDDFES
jgi:hypothetical protein